MEKAYIKAIEGREDIKVDCLFNPNAYTFTKKNSWAADKSIAENIPKIKFSGGESATLTMQLFLDTTTDGGDVRAVVKKLRKLMDINPDLVRGDNPEEKGRPPFVEFRWGNVWSFNAAITSLVEKYTLFREDGVPVRATVDLDFLQAAEINKNSSKPQNPTTVGRTGYRQWTVRDGDTIDWIAFSEYGDAAKWRYIADINNLDNPNCLKPGQVLAIAPL
jgi:nucleoid-associated protein YgaU